MSEGERMRNKERRGGREREGEERVEKREQCKHV